MKSKKRHPSPEESEESEGTERSSSSSDSESDDSSISEHRHRKKRKRANSSQSETDSEEQKRTKKRKHKKKKKKHGKKKRRSESVQSVSVEEISMSEGEISPKKKRKHKHKHDRRDRSSSISGSQAESAEEHVERRLHSVVKERRASSEESRHSDEGRRTYYQRDYRQPQAGDEPGYDREREVQRFYRGSSKERSLQQYNEQYQHDRERHNKYSTYPDKFQKPKFGQSAPYVANEDFSRRQREYDDYRRHQRYEDRRPQQEEYHGRQRVEHYQPREDNRGYNQYNNKYNQYEGFKRRENDDGRDYRERRGPPQQPAHFKEREYPDKRYQEPVATERPREVHRDRPGGRQDKPAAPAPAPHREHSRSRSTSDRYREHSASGRRAEPRDDRDREGPRVHREPPAPAQRPDARRGDTRSSETRGSDSRGPDSRGSDTRGGARDDRRDVREGRRDAREERREHPAPPRAARPPPPTSGNSADKPRERKSRFGPDDNKEYSWGKTEVKKEGEASGDREKPNFGLSGKLTEDANMVNGVVIKYTQPDDAKQPKRRWRFYPFKGDKALPILYIHRLSAFLIGRDKKVVDIILEHPSVSKQHAALQYRATPFTRQDGSTGRRVRPYIIDLDSANGTFVNNKKIEPRRYVELLERDVVKFGFSQREYVLLHENSKDDAQDDDNQEPASQLTTITTTDQIKLEKRAKEEVAEDGD